MKSTSTLKLVLNQFLLKSLSKRLQEIGHLLYFSPLQGLLDLMIAEEEELKTRLLASIESCVNELRNLYDELQMPPFEVWSLKYITLLSS